MACNIFISFAKEDIRYRDLLIGQMKNRGTPFSFEDMSLQEPFDDKWKSRCRELIRQCDGFIALLSKKTWRADGARWEMLCARQEELPRLGIHIHRDDKGAFPPELGRTRLVTWEYAKIAAFTKRVNQKRPWIKRFLDL